MSWLAAETSNGPGGGDAKFLLLLFVFLWASFAYFHHTGQHNENARFDQIRALTERREWNIDRFAGNTADVITVDGKVFPNKAPGTTFLGLLPWLLARAVLSITPLSEAWQLHYAAYFVTISTLAVFSALTGCALFSVLARLGLVRAVALTIALAYSLGTIAFPFSTVFLSHQLAASFLFLGFFLLWRQRIRDQTQAADGRHEWLPVAGAGLLLGFAPVLEYPAALGTVIIGFYALATLRWRSFLLFVGAGVVGASFLPIYSWLAFHRVLFISYEAYKAPGSAFAAQAVGIAGVSWPRLGVLWEITFRRQRGLFYVNPWLCLIIPAVITLWRDAAWRRELVVCFAMVIAFFLFNAGYGDSIVYWGGAWSVGPRHVVPMLPFMAIPIALLCRIRMFAVAAAALGAVSLLAMLCAAAIAPRVPYDSQDPFLHFYLRQLFLGRFSWNESAIFAGQLVPNYSFNIGRLLHLPARAELLPIALLWAVAIPWLFRAVRRRDEPLQPRRWYAQAAPLAMSALILACGILPIVWDPFAIERPGCKHGLAGAVVSGRFAANASSSGADATFPESAESIPRRDPVIDFTWRDGHEPLRAPFAAIWTGELYVPEDGVYSFVLESDDGSALFIGTAPIVERWTTQSSQRTTGAVQLTRGFHPVALQYENVLFSGTMRFFWAPPHLPLEIVPREFLFSR